MISADVHSCLGSTCLRVLQSSSAVSADGGGRRGPDAESDVRLLGQVGRSLLSC